MLLMSTCEGEGNHGVVVVWGAVRGGRGKRGGGEWVGR